MKLRLKNGEILELVNHCKKDKESGMMVERAGVYAIPGGAIAPVEMVVAWAMDNGATVVEL